MRILTIALLSVMSFSYAMGEEKKEEKKVRYTKGKKLDFESLLIEGQLKRPEISVVTGNAGKGDDGLLRLRTNFNDQIALESGEEIK